MDAVERQRKLPAGVATFLLTAVAVFALTGCIAPDDTTATLDGATTLPPPPTEPERSVTESATVTAAPGRPSETDEPDQTADSPGPALDPLLGLEAQLVAEGFDQPIFVTGAPETDALFVVEREGVIKVVVDGLVLETPFLDLTDRLGSSSIEQGLLGLAFDPDYASSGLFYAYWTDQNGDSVLGRFTADTPVTADPESLLVVLEVDQPAERHNAGMLQFGPDGLLYVALGDGGDGGGASQDTSNLLGSILRIAVAADGSYTNPTGNPFGNEIWVNGLRNPWRFSIDPIDGLVYVGDVGQERFEEIDVVSLDGAGTNFGWFEMEGDRCFRSGCDSDGLTIPVLQYSHDEGCSVIGGAVYRGSAIPELVGHYFFADWCEGFVRSFRYVDGTITDQADWSEHLPEVGQVTSFGVDNEAELYTVSWEGELYKIVAVR